MDTILNIKLKPVDVFTEMSVNNVTYEFSMDNYLRFYLPKIYELYYLSELYYPQTFLNQVYCTSCPSINIIL